MRGDLRGRWAGRILDGWTNRGGYRRVRLYAGGLGSDRYVHVLVLEAHVGPRPGERDEIQGCHVDGDPGNAQLINLRWDSLESNYADQVEHGTAAVGERNGRSKLSDDQREAIERSHEHRNDLAKRYGVDERTIRRIRAGRLEKT